MPKSRYNLIYLRSYFATHRWPWHVLFWLLYSAGRAFAYYITVLYYSKEVLILMLLSELVFVGLVYLTLWMYKRLPMLNLILLGIPIWVGYVALLSYSQIYFLGALPEMGEMRWMDGFIGNVKPFLITFVLLILAKYFKDSFVKQWHEERQEKMQLQTELQNLKAQVSPHFLFNTMNNFYGLAVEKSDKLPDLMVRLSALLRYSLYETQSTTVSLQREISYLENYIALEKIRLEEDLIFEFNAEINENQELKIAPLLLITLVENAFKHAKNMLTAPVEIKITLSANLEEGLIFNIRNNCQKNTTGKSFEKGIGLENLRKRLDAVYPGTKHGLDVVHLEDLFEVSLYINLQSLMI